MSGLTKSPYWSTLFCLAAIALVPSCSTSSDEKGTQDSKTSSSATGDETESTQSETAPATTDTTDTEQPTQDSTDNSSSSSSSSSSSESSSSSSASSTQGTESTSSDTSSQPNTNGCGPVIKITAIFRDFSVEGSTKHPDFESNFSGGPIKGMVQPQLDANDRPVAALPLKTNALTSAESFAQWYATDSNPTYTFVRDLEFTETDANSRIYEYVNDQFFPIGPHEGWGKQEFDKNFGFTTEIAIDFVYAPGQTFRFTGDDDLWIFIDGKLALDIGGLHSAVTDEIDLDEQAAALNLQEGKLHRMRIFHAERHTHSSKFRVRANIGCIFVPG